MSKELDDLRYILNGMYEYAYLYREDRRNIVQVVLDGVFDAINEVEERNAQH